MSTRRAHLCRRHGYPTAFSGKIAAVILHDDPAAESAMSAAPGAAHSWPPPAPAAPREVGGRDGPEPTRFGDWELRGRCIDF